jgi:DNA-binding IclR family transcriptional regulator
MVMARGAATQAGCRRGVLEGAFVILRALGCAEEGLGLTELAHETGLAKTTVHRLAEQLVDIGAAQSVGHRYYVGPTIGRLGRCWQPDPQLRQAGCGPVRALATRVQSAAAVYVLQERRAHLITAAVCRGQCWLPPANLDVESLPGTAVGRVLLATDNGDGAVGEGQWQHIRSGLADWRTVITDDASATGIRWVAAPIWRSDGRCAAALAALVTAPSVPPGLKDLVVCIARQIGQQLR